MANFTASQTNSMSQPTAPVYPNLNLYTVPTQQSVGYAQPMTLQSPITYSANDFSDHSVLITCKSTKSKKFISI
jgi:hypothetical protein